MLLSRREPQKKFWTLGRTSYANIAVPDQTAPPKEQSDQGLQCLALCNIPWWKSLKTEEYDLVGNVW